MPRLPVLPTIIVAAAVATMIALGVWQLRRADWKDDLLAQYGAAQGMSAEVAWPRTAAALEASLFRASSLTCIRVLSTRTTAATNTAGDKGVAQIARCAIDGGGEAEVELGWSLPTQTVQWAGGEARGLIGPGGQLILHQPVPPLQQLAPPDPQDMPNNHLAYAGQWFFFALTAAAIYFLALRGRVDGRGKGQA